MNLLRKLSSLHKAVHDVSELVASILSLDTRRDKTSFRSIVHGLQFFDSNKSYHEISGFHSHIAETFAFLRCYAPYADSWFRSFCTTNGPSMIGLIGCPETSVANYQPTLPNILEERWPQDV